MKNPPDFPSHLSYPPNHPAGNNWQYRGNKWSPGKVIPVYAVTDGGSWSICENKEPSGYFLHYAELVPLPAEPDYASREHQKSVLDAAWDGAECEYWNTLRNQWVREVSFRDVAASVGFGYKVRIKPEPAKPEPRMVPLEAGDVPGWPCFRRCNNSDPVAASSIHKDGVWLITGYYRDNCLGDWGPRAEFLTWAELQEQGWSYSEDRRKFTRCEKEAK